MLSIPLSLKNAEQRIITELKRENLQVFFKITNFDSNTGAIEYNLSSLDPLEEVPIEADRIVDRTFKVWRETFLSHNNT